MCLKVVVVDVMVLFNDGHILYQWSETVAVSRRMIYDGHMITGDECVTIFLTFVNGWGKTPEKTSTRKLTRAGIELEPAAWEVTRLPLDNSGELFAKVKEPLSGTRYNTRDELIHVIGCADGVERLPNIWQKVMNGRGGDYIEGT